MSLLNLSTDDLCTEIAQEQWAIILDRAEGLRMTEKEERGKKLARLALSPLDDDRRVAQLVKRQLKAKGSRG